MRLLLTGGTGFFGKALLRHWLRHPDAAPQVDLLSRDPQAFLSAHPEFQALASLRLLQGDILLPESLPRGERYTHVLHAAADSTRWQHLSPLARFDQIVQGTRHVLDIAVASGARRFLLASSGGVYGPVPVGMDRVPETFQGMPDPLDPAQAYGVGKRMAEHLCALYRERHGLETVVARCFAFVGPDLPLDAHFAIGNFIRDALADRDIVVAGDGSPVRSYLHQDDLAAWLLALLARGEPGQAYNVGSDEAVPIADLARRVRDLAAPGRAVEIQRQADPAAARSHYVPCIDKARLALGLTVTRTLAEAISDTVTALRA